MDLIEAMEEMEERAPRQDARLHTAHARPQPHSLERPLPQPTRARSAPPKAASWDIVLQQAAFVQTRLKALWAAKHECASASDSNSSSAADVRVPFSWVLAKLVRLIEEYPDGVTEAIVVTELMTQLQRRVRASDSTSTTSSGSRTVRDVDDMTRLLEAQDDALVAQLLGFDGHKLALRVEANGSSSLTLEMYLHQRFRACSAFWSSQPQFRTTSSEAYPFERGRRVVFTHAKVMERRDTSTSSDHGAAERPFSLLPTQFLALRLDAAANALDRVLLQHAIGLARLDQTVATQDAAVLQQLVVRVTVLDIGAVRPSQTPLHIHRQVLLLGDVERSSATAASATATPSSLRQPVAPASHVLILWDEQVALSRLFRVGDELVLFQPYVHVCGEQDTEIAHVLSEYASQQQRCPYYLEYGSASVFFVAPQRAPGAIAATTCAGRGSASPLNALQAFCDSEDPPLQYAALAHDWRNVSLYGHVASIRVSHGIPLMAAYFYAYYDPKTSGGGSDATPLPRSSNCTSNGAAPPTLDRAIVSRFYLVVLLELYSPASPLHETLRVEVTGANALKALRLRPGQTVLLDGLVVIDVESPAIQTARAHHVRTASPLATPSALQVADPAFAFEMDKYTARRSGARGTNRLSAPAIVALCSDWESIFGSQSVLPDNARLTLVNATPGLLTTRLVSPPPLLATLSVPSSSAPPSSRVGLVLLPNVCVTHVGWLIPTDSAAAAVSAAKRENELSSSSSSGTAQYTSDASCRKGFSTMCVHRACMRRLELAPTPPSAARATSSTAHDYVPRWQCGFCHEIFSGMAETSQTFCTLVLGLADGSTGAPLYALCHGETVEALLGTPAQDFAQLSLMDKFHTLQHVVGRDYQALVSRCAAHCVAIAHTAPAATTESASFQQQRSGASPVVSTVRVDLCVDLIAPIDAFAAAHELLRRLS